MTRHRMFSPVPCAVAGKCAACAWIVVPYEEQLRRKGDAVRAAWIGAGLEAKALDGFSIVPVLAAATRDRADVQFRREGAHPRFGFLSEGEIVSIERCPQASPALDAWIGDFRALVPSVAKGGARLRVAPDGTRGAWLDLANVDVKRLFEERRALTALAAAAVVEIGQRRKRLAFVDGAPKLVDPEPYAWFETTAGERTVPVHSVVGGFTQPGFAVNRALVQVLLRAVPMTSGRWIELGAGVGNFTVPLAAHGLTVAAVENDPLALLGLGKTLEGVPGVDVLAESFARPGGEWLEIVDEADGIVADPPRSGLGRFTEVLARSGPKHFVYVSCYPESLAKDAAALLHAGFRLATLEGVDQFPQTPHLELVARFER